MKIKDFTTGVQHIGIPTNDINKTIEFYHALGFETALRTVNGTEEVAFLQLHNLIIETYQNHQAKMEYGAVDHIAIDVKNIDDLFQVVKEAGTFKMLDQQVNGLPFWENGVKYNPQNEMFSHFGTKRYNFKNETQLFKVIPHTSKIQKNRPASPERNTFEGS